MPTAAAGNSRRTTAVSIATTPRLAAQRRGLEASSERRGAATSQAAISVSMAAKKPRRTTRSCSSTQPSISTSPQLTALYPSLVGRAQRKPCRRRVACAVLRLARPARSPDNALFFCRSREYMTLAMPYPLLVALHNPEQLRALPENQLAMLADE